MHYKLFHIHTRTCTRDHSMTSSPRMSHRLRVEILELCLNQSSSILLSLYLMQMKYILNCYIKLFNEIV